MVFLEKLFFSYIKLTIQLGGKPTKAWSAWCLAVIVRQFPLPEIIMNGKSILITGCSSGIGLCAARGLKARGYRVIASARKAGDIERLKAEGLEAVVLDLDDSESLRQAVQQTLAITGGTLDALFNNAAYGLQGAVEDLSREALRAQFETNFFGPHELVTLVLPIMRRQGKGRIIQTSSLLGLVALPYRGAYNSSKFALEGISDTLRLELRNTNIYVSLIEPGPILTRFRANAYEVFKRNINTENSIHRERYRVLEQKLIKEGAVAPFTLGPEAVLQKLIHALESPQPKIRYYVTVPTYLLVYFKRLLPDRVMDWLVGRRF
jgi:NAD(P)-dependent dehydrogenase (short-subunit alcohol dehydrogenase family)